MLKIGVCGAGSFASSFIPLFQAHPLVRDVVIAEVFADRRAEQAARFGISKTYASLDELCDSDVDAIALFTQRWLHGPQAVQALRAGKHVYSAVPTGVTVAELAELVRTVEETGLMYMLGETSYYYPCSVFCRQKWQAGEFGHFVYGEGEYLHDMGHGFYEAYQHSGGEQWKQTAGFPPMFYPTHSTSMIVGVTGASLTQVSCLGYRDRADDGIFREGGNLWNNPFSNESALFRTTDGGMCRINEFRRVGHRGRSSVRTSIFGTLGCYEEQANAQVWITHAGDNIDLTDLLTPVRLSPEDIEARKKEGVQADFFSGVAPIHNRLRLPKSFQGLHNGHLGSHQFLVDDFCRAADSGRLPPNHVWQAARYAAPGIMAHQSALQEGKLLSIPSFGDPPVGAALLEDMLY